MQSIHSAIVDYLSQFAVVQGWPEMHSLLRRVAASQPEPWQLPLLACLAVGGTFAQAVPAAAALACLQIAIILTDDMLDDDPRGEYRRIGTGAAANFAVAFGALALEAIRQSAASSTIQTRAIDALNRMALTTALGQHLDAQNPCTEDAYWRMVQTKSSPFYSAALHVGALLGGAPIQVAQQIEHLGALYGEMIQIQDDMKDSMVVPANPDWTLGRLPLPLLFAQTVNHPDRARFLSLRAHIADPEALSAAQTILIRCGAVSYCVHQLLERHQAAQNLLAAIALARRTEFETLLAEQVKPVDALFGAMSGEQ